jgi:hypothetical protein
LSASFKEKPKDQVCCLIFCLFWRRKIAQFLTGSFFYQIKKVAFDGDRVTVTCKVIGEPRPEVTWFRNNNALQKSKVYYQQSSNDLRTTTDRKRIKLSVRWALVRKCPYFKNDEIFKIASLYRILDRV